MPECTHSLAQPPHTHARPAQREKLDAHPLFERLSDEDLEAVLDKVVKLLAYISGGCCAVLSPLQRACLPA